MLGRGVSLSLLARGAAALSLYTAVGVLHRDAFSRTPPPPVAASRTSAPDPTINIASSGVGTTLMKDACVTASAGAAAAFECGDLRLVHPLPATTTMGKRRAPTLIYNSRHENGITLFPVDVFLFPGSVATFSAKVILTTPAGSTVAQSPAIQWYSWAPPQTRRINVPVNTSALATGAYQYRVVVDFNMNSGALIERTASSVVAIVNRSTSAFGKGWWLDGLEQLVAYDNTHKLWVGGDGSTRLYTQSAPNSTIWTVTPSVDRPDTLQQMAGTLTWHRNLRNGAYVEFDNLGRHVRTVNRVGQTTTFAYENASHPSWLTTIKLPIPAGSPRAGNPPSYRFTYGSSQLSGVDAPTVSGQARRVSFAKDASGVTTVTDPDNHTVKFEDPAGRTITRRIDQRGFATTYQYETAGYTLSSSTLAMQGTGDDITLYFTAAERAGIAGVTGVGLESMMTIASGPRFIYPVATRFTIDRYGAVTSVRNAVNETTTLRRDDPRFPALVTSVVHPNGFKTVATYNARALLATTTDSQPWLGFSDASPTTRYNWSGGRFDVLTSIVHPGGDSITFGYFANGDRQWEQPGSSQIRRVQYRYNASRQIGAVTSPGNNPVTEVDSVEYDRTLGNVARTLTPMRVATRYHTDDIGRVDTVYAPSGSAADRVTSTTYDLMDRPILIVDVGAANNYTLGASFLSLAVRDSAPRGMTGVHHNYDAIGNDTLVERGAMPNPTNIPLRTIYTHFDGANRKVWEMGASGAVRQWGYDASGNVTSTITPRRDTIRMEYDPLDRLTRKITPSVTYAAMSMNDGPLSFYSARFPNFADGYSHDWRVRDDPMPPPLVIPGDTTEFTYAVSGGIETARNRDSFLLRTYFFGGSQWSELQQVNGFGVDAQGLPTKHEYTVAHEPNINGQLARLRVYAPGSCNDNLCIASYAYDPDNAELLAVFDAAGPVVGFDRRPELREMTTDFSGHGSATLQWVKRDADGRAIARTTGVLGQPTMITDALAYDNANRVIAGTTDYGIDPTRSTRVENAYSGLGALAATVREKHGVMMSDKYDTDPFANVATHTARSLTENLGAVVNTLGYTTADRQADSYMTPVGWQPEYPPADILESTSGTTFDAAGNRIFHRKALEKYDRPLHAYVGANYGLEWNWSAYDAEDRLRVSQRSFFSDSVTLRTVFIEYTYDALGRRVQTRTRWDMHCAPNGRGDCQPSVERTIWDGNQIVQENRSGLYDVIPESVGEVDPCVDGSDWNTKPWCAPDYVPPPVPVRYVQSGLDNEVSYSDFAGAVRYLHAGGIDEPLLVTKSLLGTFVPVRSARGLVEDGVFLDPIYTTVNWPTRDMDSFGALDMIASDPIAPTHWLGSLVGDRRDAAGLVYMRNRYYDPGAGRFTQEDPIGMGGGLNLYGFVGGDPVNQTDPFGLCPPKDGNTSDCEAGTSGWYANRIANNQGSAALNTIGGLFATCGESALCGAVLDVASLGGAALERGAMMGMTEVVERSMSSAELDATRATGLVRGGRDGTHYVSGSVNSNALRTRQRLALPQTPEVRVKMEVPAGRFSPPSKVAPAYGMPGGGLERTGTGDIPARVLRVYPYRNH